MKEYHTVSSSRRQEVLENTYGRHTRPEIRPVARCVQSTWDIKIINIINFKKYIYETINDLYFGVVLTGEKTVKGTLAHINIRKQVAKGGIVSEPELLGNSCSDVQSVVVQISFAPSLHRGVSPMMSGQGGHDKVTGHLLIKAALDQIPADLIKMDVRDTENINK